MHVCKLHATRCLLNRYALSVMPVQYVACCKMCAVYAIHDEGESALMVAGKGQKG